ncbi:hypothetical protein [Aureitalea marina]|uniref:Lipoprotein n=1 Tax=Aureitalea marina TaxID=930804 RepID=A0A2S7KS73_9FLAO|nr:hypothetical protein [Aureitalea marina]PQB05403.1 hypothetical protein BST85_11265 [Aureitalea marina]
MKRIGILGLIAAALFATSCTEEDNTIDQVFDGVSSGAVLRGIQTISNELPIGNDDASFSIELEYQDNQDGALLESMDIYIKYADNSPDEGDSGGTQEEKFYGNVAAGQFTEGPFGLPRFTLTITAADFLATTGLTSEQIFGGDTFTTRLEVFLTDGRRFSVDNAGGIITGGFFNSPFQYTTPVVCPVLAEEFVGDYTVVNNSAGVLGFNVFEEGGTVTLVLGETSVERQFDFIFLPDAGVGQPADTFILNFVCNATVVPAGQSTNLTCGGGLTIGPAPSGDQGSYTTGDDSVFSIIFTDNSGSDCGEGPKDVTATFTKQ